MSSQVAGRMRAVSLTGILAAASLVTIFSAIPPVPVVSAPQTNVVQDQVVTPTEKAPVEMDPISTTASAEEGFLAPVLKPTFRAALPDAAAAFTPTFSAFYFGNPENSTSVRVGDLNGDGAMDIVQGNNGQPTKIFFNDGMGGLEAGVPIGGAYWTTSIALGDMNDDGALDIVQGNGCQYQSQWVCQQSLVYLNDGHGLFSTTVPFASTAYGVEKLALGDMNNDKHLDIVAISRLTNTLIFLNSAHGGWTETTFGTQLDEAVATGDLDDDGWLDIAAGGYVYWNQRNGTFISMTVYGTDWTSSIAVGDLNNDGLLDFVRESSCGSGCGYGTKVYWNIGNRQFVSQSLWSSYHAMAVDLGDMNGDSLLDIVVGNGNGPFVEPGIVYWNDVTHGFTSTTHFGESAVSNAIAVADFNADGALDIVRAMSDYGPSGRLQAQSAIYWNSGISGFVPVYSFDNWYFKYVTAWMETAVGDVNGDNLLDLVYCCAKPEYGTAVYLGDGTGGLTRTLFLESGDPYAPYRGLAIGDLDADGVLDVVNRNKVFWNDGAGVFTRTHTTILDIFDETSSVALGDMNGDGTLDVVSGYRCYYYYSHCRPSTIFLNDGAHGFTQVITLSVEYTQTKSFAIADLNGDGALDIVQGNYDQPTIIYWNNGHAGFSHIDLLSGANKTTSVAVGDLNGDGAPDIVQGNWVQPSIIYQNDGAGVFSAISSIAANRTSDIELADLNGDGTLDVIQSDIGYERAGVFIANPSLIYWNNGAGQLSAPATLGDGKRTGSVAAGDFNGDGALDVVQGNYMASSLVYLNSRFSVGTLPNNPSVVALSRPGRTRNAGFLSASDILTTAVLPVTYTLIDREGDPVGSLRAFYSPDGGGKWYTATSASGTMTNLATTTMNPALIGAVVTATAVNTTPIAISDFTVTTSPVIMPQSGLIADLDVMVNLTHTYDGDLVITLTAPSGQAVRLFNRHGGYGDNLTYTIFDDEAPTPIVSGTAPFTGRFRPFQPLSAFDGLSSVGTWRLQIADVAGGDVGRLLSWNITTTLNVGHVYTYPWDTFASGFFGQSDNVVFRMEAYPSLSSGVNGVPVFQHPYASSTTFPFRVRGTQVRVVTPTITDTQAVSQAIVYRLPKDQTFGAQAMSDSAGDPFRTDGQGYLQGRGRIDLGDTLVALAPVFTQQRDGALSFDGVNDYVTISKTVDLQLTTGTWSSWFKVSGGNDYQVLIADERLNGTQVIWSYRLMVMPDGQASFGFTTDNRAHSFFLACNSSVRDADWHQLAATRDDTAKIVRLYLDGTECTAPLTYSGTVDNSNNPVWMGLSPYNNGSYPFYGLLDDVRIWNVARTQTQIQADMESTLRGDEPGLVGYWRFDEGAGDTAHDQTSNHNDGVLNGAAWENGGEQYTLYHTSAAPNTTGLSMTPVISPGVQVLTVTANNPLILFNLDVSLEWDARQDTQFLAQLDHDLHVASEALYDWSNGQIALGKVNVYFDRDHWEAADVQIYATNRLRPNAAQGGIVNDWLTDPITTSGVITYAPGQINMGVVWNRYGETSGNLGEDWPRALAHEIAHYALFLDDDYLGLDANDRLIPLDTCAGTAMSDPYRADYSEFHPGGASWTANCTNTLMAQQVGRWDWKTITTFYPGLKSTPAITGPSGLPLAVTQIDFVEPVSNTTVLPAPIFNLTEGGAKVQPGNSARAILYQPDGRLIDLGSPTLDQVNARGARVGDRLCVYDVRGQRVGCETITLGDEELALVSQPDWTPDILVSPVTSRTINLFVTLAGAPPAATLHARLYPTDGPATAPITLTLTAGASYSGTFLLEEPAPQGYVQVWVADEVEPRESVVDYTLGGNPAYRHGTGAYRHGTGAYRHGTGAYRHGTGAYRHGTGAPTQSADGQVVVFADGLTFAPDEFLALQGVATLPAPLPGRTLVGQAYRLLKSAGAPDLANASLSFYYAGRDVPPGEEGFLRVYFWNGSAWAVLPTTVDMDYNVAVATIPAEAGGAGLYALMSSLEIPLYGPGWDLFAYPLLMSQTVTQALQPIDNAYSIVYWYNAADQLDPWKMYAVNVPAYLIDLIDLRFGEAYWISLTQTITLYLGSGTNQASTSLNVQSPPATYYGAVLGGSGFTPAAGLAVEAWVAGRLCGQSQTLLSNGEIVYSVNVNADGPGGAIGCGAPGRSIIFSVNGQTMLPLVAWNNDQIWNVPLRSAAISNLVAMNSSPTGLGQTTWFSATAIGSDLSYTWNFGDGSPAVNGANVSHSYTASGIYSVLVTATNGVNALTATTRVTVSGVLNGVSITGPLTGTLDTAYTFAAWVMPLTASLPITYVWQTPDWPPIMAVSGLSHTVVLSWTTIGVKTITVTVSNSAGVVNGTHLVDIGAPHYNVYLPLIRK